MKYIFNTIKCAVKIMHTSNFCKSSKHLPADTVTRKPLPDPMSSPTAFVIKLILMIFVAFQLITGADTVGLVELALIVLTSEYDTSKGFVGFCIPVSICGIE